MRLDPERSGDLIIRGPVTPVRGAASLREEDAGVADVLRVQTLLDRAKEKPVLLSQAHAINTDQPLFSRLCKGDILQMRDSVSGMPVGSVRLEEFQESDRYLTALQLVEGLDDEKRTLLPAALLLVARKIGDLYASLMDVERLEALAGQRAARRHPLERAGARVAVLNRRMPRQEGSWARLLGTVFAHRVFDLVAVIGLVLRDTDTQLDSGTLFGINATHARAINDRWAFKLSGGGYSQDALPRTITLVNQMETTITADTQLALAA